MKIIVTGGAGFIGSHLVERLLDRGHDVVVIDDLSSGRLENLAARRGHRGLEVVAGNAGDAGLLASRLREAQALVHLAASVGVGTIHRAPSASIRNNLLVTEAVIEATARAGVHLLYASSSEVYGKGLTPPFREDADLHLGPTRVHRWSYAAAKALGEWSALARHRETGQPLTIARFFNTVGPRQNPEQGMVLPAFVDRALAGLALEVHGTGKQTRSFAHVLDVAEMLSRLIEAPPATFRILNVGAVEEVSILELARRVRRACASASEIREIDAAALYGEDFEDTPRRIPDLSALEREIGPLPRRDLDAIIADVVAARRRSRAAIPGAGGARAGESPSLDD